MKWVLLLLLLPLANASILPTNCNSFTGEEFKDCQNILTDNSLTLLEKEDLYLNLIHNQSELPSHDFAWNRNTQIHFDQPPEQVVPKNNGPIQKAWLKIIAIKKSVFDTNQNKWFTQPKGSILFAKNFSIELPNNPLPGECQTNYSSTTLQNQLEIFANNQLIGASNQTDYSLELPNRADLNFLAKWQLEVQLQTEHYYNQEHCYWTGTYWQCWNQCDYSHTTQENYSLELEDHQPTTILKNDYSIQIAIHNKEGYEKIFLQFQSPEPLNHLELAQEKKQFSLSQARYDITQTLSPYGVLYIERIPEQKINTKFIILDRNQNQFVLSTNSSQDCQLQIITDFEEEKKNCNSIYLKKAQINLETDQNSFDQNQTIKLNAQLVDDQNQGIVNKPIVFSSKNIQETSTTDSKGKTTWTIPANQSNGIITASFTSDFEFAPTQTTKRIAIAGTDQVPTAIKVFSFFFSYYFLFIIVKRKIGGI